MRIGKLTSPRPKIGGQAKVTGTMRAFKKASAKSRAKKVK